ncbi:hypothetical protein B0J14DRAFT_634539 [Halenospora varia]|nr:hypothetical protein B0J14DRAFT_634539 [Halenospora varia]
MNPKMPLDSQNRKAEASQSSHIIDLTASPDGKTARQLPSNLEDTIKKANDKSIRIALMEVCKQIPEAADIIAPLLDTSVPIDFSDAIFKPESEDEEQQVSKKRKRRIRRCIQCDENADNSDVCCEWREMHNAKKQSSQNLPEAPESDSQCESATDSEEELNGWEMGQAC